MPKRAHVNDTIYREWSLQVRRVNAYVAVDDAEGFILEHALISPPRTWPPLPHSTQQTRLTSNKRKMDWNSVDNVDEEVEIPQAEDGEGEKERCVICLMGLRDRTIAGVCGHEFCVSLSLGGF
jgi:E3 ubiquitin-protein ligase Topors